MKCLFSRPIVYFVSFNYDHSTNYFMIFTLFFYLLEIDYIIRIVYTTETDDSMHTEAF